MHHFKAASLRLQSLNQCGNIETEASMNLTWVLWKETRLIDCSEFLRSPKVKIMIYETFQEISFDITEKLYENTENRNSVITKVTWFCWLFVIQVGLPAGVAAIMCSCYSEVVGEFEGLSATVAAGWIRYFAALVKIWCQDNNGHQQRLPGWLLNTSWSGCSAQSLAACFRGSVLTHHRRR